MPELDAFLNDPTGLAVKAALVAAFLDFAFGVFAAARDGTFALDSLASFVRKHLLGRVFPVGLLAVTGYVTGDAAMKGAAAVALAAYTAETIGSIYGSLKPPAQSVTEAHKAAAAVNPVPRD
jgi:hypothetical protein